MSDDKIMDNQEAFDRAVEGVLRQGGPSIDGNGDCLYRNNNGRKCAAGHLIPDARYVPEFEGNMANTPCVRVAIDADCDFVSRLQYAHDKPFKRSFELNKTPPSDDEFLVLFIINVKRVAERYGLSTAVIDAWESRH